MKVIAGCSSLALPPGLPTSLSSSPQRKPHTHMHTHTCSPDLSPFLHQPLRAGYTTTSLHPVPSTGHKWATQGHLPCPNRPITGLLECPHSSTPWLRGPPVITLFSVIPFQHGMLLLKPFPHLLCWLNLPPTPPPSANPGLHPRPPVPLVRPDCSVTAHDCHVHLISSCGPPPEPCV